MGLQGALQESRINRVQARHGHTWFHPPACTASQLRPLRLLLIKALHSPPPLTASWGRCSVKDVSYNTRPVSDYPIFYCRCAQGNRVCQGARISVTSGHWRHFPALSDVADFSDSEELSVFRRPPAMWDLAGAQNEWGKSLPWSLLLHALACRAPTSHPPHLHLRRGRADAVCTRGAGTARTLHYSCIVPALPVQSSAFPGLCEAPCFRRFSPRC